MGLGAGLALSKRRDALRPTLSLDFLTGAMPGGVTFTRASAAWIYDGSTLTPYATNAARLTASGLLIEESRTNLLLGSAALATQSVTVTASAHTLSFYGTGTVTLSGASTAGPLIGTGAANRVALTFTPAAGALTCTVSGDVRYANLELGGFATSAIVTAGSTVTRAADVATVTAGAWFNAQAGTLMAEASIPVAGTSGAFACAALTNNTLSHRYLLAVTQTLVSSAYRVSTAGVAANPGDQTVSGVASGIRMAMAYTSGAVAATANGQVPTTAAPATLPTVTQLDIGAQAGSTWANGHIRRVRYFNSRLPNATLQGMTWL